MKMMRTKQRKAEKSKNIDQFSKDLNDISLENMKKHPILNMVMLFSINSNKKFATHLIKSFGTYSFVFFFLLSLDFQAMIGLVIH